MNDYIVYRHYRNDTNKVFYIGMSKNKNRRPFEFSETKRSTEWLKVFNQCSRDVRVEVLGGIGMSKSDATELERFLIEETDGLVNAFHNNFKHTDATREKMLEGAMGNPSTSKKVIDLSNDKVYNSIKDAAEDLGINHTTLRAYLNPNRKTINKTTLRYE